MVAAPRRGLGRGGHDSRHAVRKAPRTSIADVYRRVLVEPREVVEPPRRRLKPGRLLQGRDGAVAAPRLPFHAGALGGSVAARADAATDTAVRHTAAKIARGSRYSSFPVQGDGVHGRGDLPDWRWRWRLFPSLR